MKKLGITVGTVLGVSFCGATIASAQEAQGPQQTAIAFVQEFFAELHEVAREERDGFFAHLDLDAPGFQIDDAVYDPIHERFLKSVATRSRGSLASWKGKDARGYSKWLFFTTLEPLLYEEGGLKLTMLDPADGAELSTAWVRIESIRPPDHYGVVHFLELESDGARWFLRGPPLFGSGERYLDLASLPIARNAVAGLDGPAGSPHFDLRWFPAGGISVKAQDWYEGAGIPLPTDREWVDVVWKGRPLAYPGIEHRGARVELPRHLAKFEFLATTMRDRWLPFMETRGAGEPGEFSIETVLLRPHANAPFSWVDGILDVAALDEIRLWKFRIATRRADVAVPGFLEFAHRPPLGLLHQVEPAEIEVGLDLDHALELAARADPDATRVTIRYPRSATVADVVAVLDPLHGHGFRDFAFTPAD